MSVSMDCGSVRMRVYLRNDSPKLSLHVAYDCGSGFSVIYYLICLNDCTWVVFVNEVAFSYNGLWHQTCCNVMYGQNTPAHTWSLWHPTLNDGRCQSLHLEWTPNCPVMCFNTGYPGIHHLLQY